MNHIVISPLHETRINVAERHHARSRQSGGESHGMSFGDTDVETTLRHLFHQNIHRTARRHGRRYPHDPLVGTGQIEQRLSENILISGHLGLADDPLARFRIEFARSVPYRLIALGRLIALSFYGHHMQQLGTLDAPQGRQHPHQFRQIMPVDRTEIAEIQTFEQIAVLQQPLLDGIARFLTKPQNSRRMGQNPPQTAFDSVVAPRRRNLDQVVLQSPGSLVDGHVVIVENDQQVGLLARSGVVQPFERQTARHRTVADHGHHLPLLALEFRSFGHTERRRNRHGGMSAAESVVRTLGHTREAADTAQLTIGPKRLAAPGNDFMGIGLMPHVPHDFIVRSIEYVVQSDGKLHRPQARSQVSRIGRTLLDDVLTQFVAILTQVRARQLLQVIGRINPIEPFIFRMHHG